NGSGGKFGLELDPRDIEQKVCTALVTLPGCLHHELQSVCVDKLYDPPVSVELMATSKPSFKKNSRTLKRTPPAKPLQTISAREFAARFANGVSISQQSFTWFLGAGCSRT